MKNFFMLFGLLSFLLHGSVFAAKISDGCDANHSFLVGAGIYDITGPAAERAMMGYAELSQKTTGILQRDWARAFIIKSPCNGKEVVFVNADLAMLFQGVQQEVLRQLKKHYADEYTASNVILSAIHQHSGPGGYATHALYNLSTLGFDKKNFAAICDGIVKAIDRARENMQPATISIAQGQLTNANINRSPSAYLLNPASERKRYQYDRDTTMTVLRFNRTDDTPIGMINWFPVHGTSLSKENRLISGDNKGYAAYLFERDYHSDHRYGSFVAAFAQANAGDISPNLSGKGGATGAAGKALVEQIGGRQYQEARQLFASAKTQLVGGIHYRQQNVAMGASQLMPDFSNPFDTIHRTCPAAIGESMIAGTTDGDTGLAKQGIAGCKQLEPGKPKFICDLLTKKTACQGVKPIILETNTEHPPWTPTVLPLSVVTIGDLAIVANPFELTTMAGRRVRELVAKALKPMGVKYVVIAGYSNGYGGYVTTPEEYEAQRYEGASNLFGARSLNLQLQVYSQLCAALRDGKPAPDGAQVPDTLAWPQKDLQTDVVFDDTPAGKHFGDVIIGPKTSYQPGDTVTVEFAGAMPKNSYRTMDTFLTVEQKVDGEWTRIRDDDDWDTAFQWKRDGIAASVVTITWQIPKGQAKGTYRIGYFGDKKALLVKPKPFEGYSAAFKVG